MDETNETKRRSPLESMAPPGSRLQESPSKQKGLSKDVDVTPPPRQPPSFLRRAAAWIAGGFAVFTGGRLAAAQVAAEPTSSQVGNPALDANADSLQTVDITLTPGVPPRNSPESDELHKRLDEIEKAIRQPTVILLKDAPTPTVERSEQSIELLKLLVTAIPAYGALLISCIQLWREIKKAGSNEENVVTINVGGKIYQVAVESEEDIEYVNGLLNRIERGEAVDDAPSS